MENLRRFSTLDWIVVPLARAFASWRHLQQLSAAAAHKFDETNLVLRFRLCDSSLCLARVNLGSVSETFSDCPFRAFVPDDARYLGYLPWIPCRIYFIYRFVIRFILRRICFVKKGREERELLGMFTATLYDSLLTPMPGFPLIARY
jgi:hypothetical protein